MTTSKASAEWIVGRLIIHQHFLPVRACRLKVIDPNVRNSREGTDMAPTRPSSLTARCNSKLLVALVTSTTTI